MKPMNRKALEALVGDAEEGWREGHHLIHEYPLKSAVTDALWAAMVPTRRAAYMADKDEACGVFDCCPSFGGPARRILICIDEPAPTREENIKTLAEWVMKMIPVPAEIDDGLRVRRIAYEILKEADDA